MYYHHNHLSVPRRGRWGVKLSAGDIPSIRALEGVKKAKEVAEMFGVRANVIRFVWQGRTWKHVPEVASV